MRKSKVIVLPYLRNTNIENTVSTSNVAYKNEKENFPKCDEYDEYSIIYNELNNSISNIHGESQLIELFTQDNKIYSDKRYLTKRVNSIKQNCLKLTKSINNLIQFQKIERKQLFSCVNNVNIVDIIDNIVVKTSEYIKNKIIFDTNIEEKYMSCDINMFQKAILILLFQAAKHSDENENAIFVNLNVFEEKIRITVSFNNKESKLLDLFIEKLDNPMHDISDELSLELYLCKSLIAMHEGSISVGKNDDEIIFKIELPCRNTDYIYNLYTNYINNQYLTEQIQI